MKVYWPDALWAWPLTFLVVIGAARLSRSIPFFASFLDSSWDVGGIVFGAMAGVLFGLGFRRGFRLVQVSPN